jgi:nitroreductase
MSISSEKLKELIKERRSVREFNGEKISRDIIISVIEAGIWAPSGCNNQELRFLIIDDKEKIDEILEFKPFFKGVSCFVLIFYDMSLPMSRRMYRKNRAEIHLPYIDTGLALANMILYAKSLGIDSCIFNLSEYHFKKIQEKKALIKKLFDKVLIELELYRMIDKNFQFYLRKDLKILKNLEILCGVAFGYARKYPDIRSEVHGGKEIMRKKVDSYIINYK